MAADSSLTGGILDVLRTEPLRGQFVQPPTVLLVMVEAAEPAHLPWLVVVVVVHLLAWRSAHLAWLALQVAPAQTGVGIGARVGPPERFTLEAVCLAPLAHVLAMAAPAIALARPVALA